MMDLLNVSKGTLQVAKRGLIEHNLLYQERSGLGNPNKLFLYEL